MLTITGYSDRIYCRPGETLEFKVNCEAPRYHADIVRIICGDTNPDGPGVKEVVIDTPVSGPHAGRLQSIRAGSYVEVPNVPALDSFSVEAYIWPTTPTKGIQGLITRRSESAGFALIVDHTGSVALQLADGEHVSTISTGRPMQPRRWYRVGARVDAATRAVEVFQIPLAPVPGIDDAAAIDAVLSTHRGTPPTRCTSRHSPGRAQCSTARSTVRDCGVTQRRTTCWAPGTSASTWRPRPPSTGRPTNCTAPSSTSRPAP